jgi:phosphoribosylanthranilate isomerase
VRTRVKICGITRKVDALAVVEAGGDAIGLNFSPFSPRYVALEQADEISRSVPPFVTVVGLFVNAAPYEVDLVLKHCRLDLLQFHGDESPEDCRRYGKPYIKAIRVQPETNLIQYAEDFSDAKALLLDAYVDGVAGGTGRVFDWNLIPKSFPLPLILAGGLTPENVQDAIQQVRPYAVDVSGGVEIQKGIKSAEKITAFMLGVSHATL